MSIESMRSLLLTARSTTAACWVLMALAPPRSARLGQGAAELGSAVDQPSTEPLHGLLQRECFLDGLSNSDTQIVEVYRLCEEVESAKVERPPYRPHIPVRGYDDRPHEREFRFQPGHKRKAVHARKLDVGEDDVYLVPSQFFERVLSAADEYELEFPVPYLSPELLGHEELEIGFVVDHEYSRGRGVSTG